MLNDVSPTNLKWNPVPLPVGYASDPLVAKKVGAAKSFFFASHPSNTPFALVVKTVVPGPPAWKWSLLI